MKTRIQDSGKPATGNKPEQPKIQKQQNGKTSAKRGKWGKQAKQGKRGKQNKSSKGKIKKPSSSTAKAQTKHGKVSMNTPATVSRHHHVDESALKIAIKEVENLQKRVHELEHLLECPLCMAGRREVALVGCGHTMCAGCLNLPYSNPSSLKCPFCCKSSQSLKLYHC